MRLAVSLDIKRLGYELKKIVGAVAVKTPAANPKVGLSFHYALASPQPALEKQVLTVISRELEQLGVEPHLLKNLSDSGREVYKRQGLVLLLAIQLNTEAVEGIRGLDLSGVKGTLSLRGTVVVSGTEALEERAEGWGWGEEQLEAQEMAVQRAVQRILPPLMQAIKQHCAVAKAPEDERVLRISGITSLGQFFSLSEALEKKISGVRQSLPFRLSLNEAWFKLFISDSIEANELAMELMQQNFAQFKLELRSASGGSAWLAVSSL
jgi:hypothetical protein